MATVIAMTSLQLSADDKKKLIDASAAAIKEVAPRFSFYYQTVPAENVSGDAVDQITYLVFVPPTKPIEYKRQMIKGLNDAVLSVTGYKGELKVIVIFKYHEDDSVGCDGVLRLDAKAQQK